MTLIWNFCINFDLHNPIRICNFASDMVPYEGYKLNEPSDAKYPFRRDTDIYQSSVPLKIMELTITYPAASAPLSCLTASR